VYWLAFSASPSRCTDGVSSLTHPLSAATTASARIVAPSVQYGPPLESSSSAGPYCASEPSAGAGLGNAPTGFPLRHLNAPGRSILHPQGVLGSPRASPLPPVGIVWVSVGPEHLWGRDESGSKFYIFTSRALRDRAAGDRKSRYTSGQQGGSRGRRPVRGCARWDGGPRRSADPRALPRRPEGYRNSDSARDLHSPEPPAMRRLEAPRAQGRPCPPSWSPRREGPSPDAGLGVPYRGRSPAWVSRGAGQPAGEEPQVGRPI
jgi:hypothetical protein